MSRKVLQNVLSQANTLYQREERGKYHSSGTPSSFWESVIIITIMRQIGVQLNWTHYKTAGEVGGKKKKERNKCQVCGKENMYFINISLS